MHQLPSQNVHPSQTNLILLAIILSWQWCWRLWYLVSWCLLFISQRNLIEATDLLEYIPVCHRLTSNAKFMSCTIYRLPSHYVVRIQDAWVGLIWYSWTEYSVSVWVVLAKCTVYQSKHVRWKDARTPKSKCGSKSDQFDIAGHDTVMMLLEVIVLGFMVLVIASHSFLKEIS